MGSTASGIFAPTQVQAVVDSIDNLVADMTLSGAGPVKLIVALNPALHRAAQVAFATAFDSAFSSYVGNSRIVFVGISFAPTAAGVTVHFPLLRGIEAVSPRPSSELTELGFANDATTLAGQIKQDLYVLDAAKFASKCLKVATSGRDIGVTGDPYVFDKNTVISQLTHDDGTIAAGQTLPSSGVETGLRYNGRTSGRAVVPAK